MECLLSDTNLCILTLKSHGCVRLCDQGTYHPGKGACPVRGAPLKGPGDRSSREAVGRVPGGGSPPWHLNPGMYTHTQNHSCRRFLSHPLHVLAPSDESCGAALFPPFYEISLSDCNLTWDRGWHTLSDFTTSSGALITRLKVCMRVCVCVCVCVCVRVYTSCYFYSVNKSCLTLFDPMKCRISGFPVLYYLPEFAQIHGH